MADLKAYDLSCGGVQRVENNGISVRLYREHSVYHVRAHDLREHRRLAWKFYTRLSDARKEFKRLVLSLKREEKGETQ